LDRDGIDINAGFSEHGCQPTELTGHVSQKKGYLLSDHYSSPSKTAWRFWNLIQKGIYCHLVEPVSRLRIISDCIPFESGAQRAKRNNALNWPTGY
jgi:hypothetical protein